MRVCVVLLALACAVQAEKHRYLLLGIRDDPQTAWEATPARVVLSVDIFTPYAHLATREVVVRDEAMRACMFADPFIVPGTQGFAYLFATDGDGLRCVRIALSRREESASSVRFATGDPGTFRSRPVHVVGDRIAFLRDDGLLSIELRLNTVARTEVPLRPVHFDPVANRVYVLDGTRVGHHALLAVRPPGEIEGSMDPDFPLPDATAVTRASLRDDGLRIAYASPSPARREDARRFLLSVSDNLGRLILRQSFPGRLHDLRWLDDGAVLFTATQDEATVIRVLDVASGAVRAQPLGPRYLAPPEIVDAALVEANR